ncbi:MAG TPA: IPT/TIG domain-containing protein [Solirubrobacteraceae bacterium]|nr:IPT/TIG domain-containing protein [Solirubrobacteraceae bacterium]
MGLGVVCAVAFALMACAGSALAAAPVISNLEQRVGPEVGGLSVTVDGSGFTGTTSVSFGGVPATFFAPFNDGHQMHVGSPLGVGVVDVTVTTPEGTSEIVPADKFTYRPTPEFGICAKVGFEAGTFGAGGCLGEDNSGFGSAPYQWYRGFESTRPLKQRGFTFDAAKGLKLETATKAKITCASGSAGGEITGDTTLALATLKFTGCQSNIAHAVASCQGSGLGSGEIETGPLDGQMGITALSFTPAKDLTGVELSPLAGETFSEFSCGATPVTIRGAIILEMKKPNKMVEKLGWKATAKKGVQKTTSFVEQPAALLEVKLGEGGYEAVGLKLTATGVTEEALEFNTIV